jgi:predicted transcriptional regulator
LAITSDTGQFLIVLSNPKACRILETTYVANEEGVEGHIIANHANLSPSGFYRLMLSLREKNMIERKNQRYYITFLGKAVYNTRRILQKAIDNYPKLNVIDLLEEQHRIPEPELKRIIEICIDDHQLKDILTTRRKDSWSYNG